MKENYLHRCLELYLELAFVCFIYFDDNFSCKSFRQTLNFKSFKIIVVLLTLLNICTDIPFQF